MTVGSFVHLELKIGQFTFCLRIFRLQGFKTAFLLSFFVYIKTRRHQLKLSRDLFKNYLSLLSTSFLLGIIYFIDMLIGLDEIH